MKAETEKPGAQRDMSALVEKTLRHGTKILVAILMIYLVLEALPARAGGGIGGFAGATEITQIQNNVELALQTVQEQMQSVELVQQTYLQQMQLYADSIGKYTAPFQKAYDMYQKVKGYQDKLAGLQGNLGNLQGALQNRFTQFSASNLSWDGWMKREGQLIQDGNQRAIAQVQSNQEVLASTKESMEAYQKAAAGMDKTTGTHQATRMLGSQLTLLGGDLNKLIAITAQANAVKAMEIQERAAEREAGRTSADQIRALQAAMDKKRRAELEAILRKEGK